MEFHLDLIGGLAGDMFIAALLDAFPQYESTVLRAIADFAAQEGLTCAALAHTDGVLCGRRFVVQRHASPSDALPLMGALHQHTTWESIRRRLTESSLHPEIRRHAAGIFQLLADAEAAVHGGSPDAVSFHEVGAWDSIADIIGAATLIQLLGATAWTCSPAPLGSGRVGSAHGILSVPAPATTQLLMGMRVLDDGIPGERVTPTGAAILRYLCPPTGGGSPGAIRGACPPARILRGSGSGFGMRILPGISNHVRVLCFETDSSALPAHRTVHVIEFEVDDQSGEDLAMGLDRLRAHPAVLDVTQSPVFGKKGRMMAHLQLLVRNGHCAAVIDACFRETTTIGLRYRDVSGVGLERRVVKHIDREGRLLRVKVAERPGGMTAKAEADDVLAHAEHAQRSAMRREAETAAIRAATVASSTDVIDA